MEYRLGDCSLTKLSSSKERGSFQRDCHIKRALEQGKEPSQEYLDMIDRWEAASLAREADPEFQEDNLEYDLRTCEWMLHKVRDSEVYAQNLYCALCNNDFVKHEVMPILKEQLWHCSWRYAGGIIADMRQEGDYIDWYCSGIRDDYEGGYVAESDITEEIKQDLLALGWLVYDKEDR